MRHELKHVALRAQDDLTAEAVIITTSSADIAAVAGIQLKRARSLVPALHRDRVAGYDMPATLLHEANGAGDPVDFASFTRAPIEFDGSPLGTLFALYSATDPKIDQRVLHAFANYAATIISYAEPTGGSHARADLPVDFDEIGSAVTSATSFRDVIEAIDAIVSHRIGSISTGVMLFNEAEQILQLVPGSFGVDGRTAASCRIKKTDVRSNGARVFRTGEVFISNDARKDPAILEDYAKVLGLTRLMSLPLILRGRTIGTLHFNDKRGRDFTHEDLRFAEEIAPRLASAVNVAATILQIRRQHWMEKVLSDVAVSIAAGESIEHFFSPALAEFCAATGAAAIALIPCSGPPLIRRHETTGPGQEADLIEKAQKNVGRPTAYVTRPTRAGDPGSATFHLPISLAGTRVATLSVLRNRGESLAADERDALSRLAKLAGLAWATEGYQQQRAELARVDERLRIADDLHDDVAQILFGAQISLDVIVADENTDATTMSRASHARALLVKADEALRALIHDSAAATPSNLVNKLAFTVAEVESAFGLAVHLEITSAAAERADELRRPLQELILRVARETLVNASKHAGPCRAIVRLRMTRQGRLVLTVVDDGIGITAASRNGHGMTALRRVVRNRGGLLRVQSNPTGGTTVVASVPLDG